MRFKIHRPANENGVLCLEVWTETDMIVIDLGMPLTNPGKMPFDSETEPMTADELMRMGILPDIPSLYQDNSNTAVFISHSHRDHHCLISRINPSCKVYTGFVTQILTEMKNSSVDNEWTIQNARHVKHWTQIKVGNITVSPVLMDHLAFDSFAYLIEADGKSLFFSGDFRKHGKMPVNLDWFCKTIRKSVDYFLFDDSAINSDESSLTESELEGQFAVAIRQTKGITLVYSSGWNIERLLTIYKACEKCNIFFLVDFLTANILKDLNKRANKSIPFPSTYNFRSMKVYYPPYLVKKLEKLNIDAETSFPFKPYKIDMNKLDARESGLVMLVRPDMQDDLEKHFHKFESGCFIYSMQDSYKTQSADTKEFIGFIKSKAMPIKDLHSWGHADSADLKKLEDALKPKQTVPICNFSGEAVVI